MYQNNAASQCNALSLGLESGSLLHEVKIKKTEVTLELPPSMTPMQWYFSLDTSAYIVC